MSIWLLATASGRFFFPDPEVVYYNYGHGFWKSHLKLGDFT